MLNVIQKVSKVSLVLGANIGVTLEPRQTTPVREICGAERKAEPAGRQKSNETYPKNDYYACISTVIHPKRPPISLSLFKEDHEYR